MKSRSRKAAISRRNFGTPRAFDRCMVRARQRRVDGCTCFPSTHSKFSPASNETVDATEAAYREYKFNEVAQRLYDFFWSDYCDWFIEAAKTEIFSDDEARKKSVLAVMDFVLSGFSGCSIRSCPISQKNFGRSLGSEKDSSRARSSSLRRQGRVVIDRS